MNKSLPSWLKSHLVEYKKINYIPQTFNDSTHQLWRLTPRGFNQEKHFLKVCSHTDSPFWQLMQELFDFKLRTEIANFAYTYNYINKACRLDIPELLKAETLPNDNDANDDNAYILTAELKGVVLDSNITNQMVKQLAVHLVELHSKKISTWGAFDNPKFISSEWPKHLEAILIESDKKWGGVFLGADKYLKQARKACSAIESTEFVPMMPDLRWDQFLQTNNVITALVDLDAFVFAPRELDFVILEYLLKSDQISTFKTIYSKYHEVPEIESVRPGYRLLLFYMQILGENNLDDWMNSETFF